MTIRHLRVFVAVCEQGGITRAAEALHMVQPAVSTTVSELEKYYKAALFERINQRLVLTELGRELLVKAKNILAEFEEFEETATLGGQHPRLRIGSSLTLGKTVLPRFLSGLREAFPSMEPTFVIERSGVIEGRVECGELDIGIIEGDVHSERLRKIPFGEDRLLAVCAPQIFIEKRLALEELVNAPLLLREKESASRDMLEKVLSEAHLRAIPLVESISNQALISFAKEGHGIAILPEGILRSVIARGELCTLNVEGFPLSRAHHIVMRKNKRFNVLSCEAIELLQRISSELEKTVDIEKNA